MLDHGRRWMWRFVRLLRRMARWVTREFIPGLELAGRVWYGLPPVTLPPASRRRRADDSPERQPGGHPRGREQPPVGHPERVVPGAPMSAAERRLWEEIEDGQR
jgi:hypothetical protein